MKQRNANRKTPVPIQKALSVQTNSQNDIANFSDIKIIHCEFIPTGHKVKPALLFRSVDKLYQKIKQKT